MPSRVFLVGPMGAGKSAVGRALAARLDLPFVDADLELERRLGVDLGYVFEREGEAGFRRRESALLAELVGGTPLVLATGGGAVLAEENRELLRAHGTVVFLSASLASQAARTRRTGHRPLLAQAEDPEAALAELYAVREPLYRGVAHLEVATDGREVREIAEELAGRLSRP